MLRYVKSFLAFGLLALLLTACGKESEISQYLPVKANTMYSYVTFDEDGNVAEDNSKYEVFMGHINGNVYQRYIFAEYLTLTEVMEEKDGVLTSVYSSTLPKGFENLTGKRIQNRIILQEPIKVGAKWNPVDGETAEITAVDKEITVAYGTFKTIEVTITSNMSEYATRRYYAKGVGEVRTEWVTLKYDTDKDGNIISEVVGTPASREMAFVTENLTSYGMGIAYISPVETDEFEVGSLSFGISTGGDAKTVFFDNLKKELAKKGALELSDTTKINSIVFDDEDYAHIDFSASLIEDLKKCKVGELTAYSAVVSDVMYFAFTDLAMITVDGKEYIPEGAEESEYIAVRSGFVYAVSLGN